MKDESDELSEVRVLEPQELLETMRERLETDYENLRDSIAELDPDDRRLAHTLSRMQGSLEVIRQYRDWLNGNLSFVEEWKVEHKS